MTPYEYILSSPKSELSWSDSDINRFSRTESMYVNHALFYKDLYGRLIFKLSHFEKRGHNVSVEFRNYVTGIGAKYLHILRCIEKGEWDDIH